MSTSTVSGLEVLRSLRALHLSPLFSGDAVASGAEGAYVELKSLQGYAVAVGAHTPLTRHDGDLYVKLLDHLYDISTPASAARDALSRTAQPELRYTWPEFVERAGMHDGGSTRKLLKESLSRLLATPIRIVTPQGSVLETVLITAIKQNRDGTGEIVINFDRDLLSFLQRDAERVSLPASTRTILRVTRQVLAARLMETALAHKQRTVRITLRDLLDVLGQPATTAFSGFRRNLRSALEKLRELEVVESFDLPDRAREVSITLTKHALLIAAAGETQPKEATPQASLFDS